MTSAPESRGPAADTPVRPAGGAARPAQPPDQPDGDAEAFPERPVAESVTFLGVVLVPLAAVVATLAGRTWLTVAFLVLAPVVLVVWVAGLIAFAKVLRRRSLVRRGLGHVPRRYHVYGWVWAASFVGAALSPFVGGDGDRAWLAQVGLLAASAVVAGVGSAAVWSAYIRDMRWRDAPED